MEPTHIGRPAETDAHLDRPLSVTQQAGRREAYALIYTFLGHGHVSERGIASLGQGHSH